MMGFWQSGQESGSKSNGVQRAKQMAAQNQDWKSKTRSPRHTKAQEVLDAYVKLDFKSKLYIFLPAQEEPMAGLTG